MPPVAGRFPGPAGQAAANDYDSFAEAYSAGNEASLLNTTWGEIPGPGSREQDHAFLLPRA